MTHRNPPLRVVGVGVATLSLFLTNPVMGRVGLGPPSETLPTETVSTADTEPDAPVLVGEVTREQIEAAMPDWVRAQVESVVDPQAAQALAAVPPAEIIVYLGTWCSDSRREVPRFWRALDQTGGMVPFTVEYVTVDEDKQEPAGALEGVGLEYVPTFVVRRDGEEIGRVVEVAEDGIERDLLALLTGEARGVVSGRDEGLTVIPDPRNLFPRLAVSTGDARV